MHKPSANIFVQARLGSSRLPGKVLEKIGEVSILEYLYTRLLHAKNVCQVIFLTPEGDGALHRYLDEKKVPYFKGNELDVLDRFYKASLTYPSDYIVRCTGDCPFVDPYLIDEMVQHVWEHPETDYIGFGMTPTYPDGLGTEVFRTNALHKAWRNGHQSEDREHVTWYIRRHPDIFTADTKSLAQNWGHIRCTVDTQEDLDVVRNLLPYLEESSAKQPFRTQDIISLYQNCPNLFSHGVVRDEKGPNPIQY